MRKEPQKTRTSPQSERRIRIIMVAIVIAGLTAWFCWPHSTTQMESQVATALEKGNLSVAEVWLRRLHHRRPNDTTVLQLLADVAYRQGRLEDCLDWLAVAAEHAPQPPAAFVGVGTRAFEFHFRNTAETMHRRALRADPQFLPAYGALARLFLITRQPMALRALFVEADQHHVDVHDDPLLLWLWVVGDSGRWGDSEAENWLRKAHEVQPDDPIVAAALTRLLVQSSRAEAAETLWSVKENNEPHQWIVQLPRAEFEFHQDHRTACADSLRSLPDESNHEPRTWLLRAHLFAAGQPELALELVEEALRIDPMMVEAANLRGQLLVKMNRAEQGRKQLEQAAQLDQLIQRTLQLLQQSSPDPKDALLAAETAAALGQARWAELVCRWAQRRSKTITLSEPLLAVRKNTASQQPLTMSTADRQQQRALQQRFETALREMDLQTVTPSSELTTPIRLKDVTASMELDFHYDYGRAPEHWLMETLGGGVAAFDFDLDGWDDLFFAQAGRLSPTEPGKFRPCALFRNQWGQRFENVAATAQSEVYGYIHGCTTADLNEDGFADLLLSGYGRTVLLWNQGDGTWHDGTEAAGLMNGSWTTSGSAIDLDRDGDLDLYQAAYCVAPLSPQLKTCREGAALSSCRPNAYPPARDFLWENLGDGRFIERSSLAELDMDRGYGLGVIAADFDFDGWPDVFVGNDTTPNFLFWNAGREFSLQESGMLAGVGVDGQGRAEACMGIACGDIDGNGLLDLFVTNFHDETATLYVNRGERFFEDRTDAAGLAQPARRLMGWGTQFVDLNADGWLDVIIVNGHLHDTPQLPQAFRNDGGRFTEVSASTADYFQQPRLGRSVAVGDFNGDGRDDLAISHQVEPAVILQNTNPTGQSVRIRCLGTSSPRDAMGTIIRARMGTRELVRVVSRQGGYLSSCSPDLSLGLGDATQIDTLEVTWPNGSTERLEKIHAGTQWLLREGQSPLTMTPPVD